MSLARAAFYLDLRAMQELARETILSDSSIPHSSHNVKARILRRGIVVSSFSCLEYYFEQRLKEVLKRLETCAFGYNDFTVNLKEFFTHQAIIGLTNRLQFQENSEKLQFAEDGIAMLSRYSGIAPNFSSFGFSPKGSNVSSQDISAVFKSFGIRAPWEKMTEIARLIGSTLQRLDEVYIQLSKTRNKAAHDSSWNISINDLSSRLLEITYIGICYDILISITIEKFSQANAHATAIDLLAEIDPKLYFVDQLSESSWGERARTGQKIIKKHPSEAKACSRAKQRATNGFVIIRSIQQLPIELA